MVCVVFFVVEKKIDETKFRAAVKKYPLKINKMEKEREPRGKTSLHKMDEAHNNNNNVVFVHESAWSQLNFPDLDEVNSCFVFLHKYGVRVPGIFLHKGQTNLIPEIQRLCKKDNVNLPDFAANEVVEKRSELISLSHTAASVILRNLENACFESERLEKDFSFRIPSSVFVDSSVDSDSRESSDSDLSSFIDRFQAFYASVSEACRLCLHDIFFLLYRIDLHAKLTNMNSLRLATVFSPLLIEYPVKTPLGQIETLLDDAIVPLAHLISRFPEFIGVRTDTKSVPRNVDIKGFRELYDRFAPHRQDANVLKKSQEATTANLRLTDSSSSSSSSSASSNSLSCGTIREEFLVSVIHKLHQALFRFMHEKEQGLRESQGLIESQGLRESQGLADPQNISGTNYIIEVNKELLNELSSQQVSLDRLNLKLEHQRSYDVENVQNLCFDLKLNLNRLTHFVEKLEHERIPIQKQLKLYSDVVASNTKNAKLVNDARLQVMSSFIKCARDVNDGKLSSNGKVNDDKPELDERKMDGHERKIEGGDVRGSSGNVRGSSGNVDSQIFEKSMTTMEQSMDSVVRNRVKFLEQEIALLRTENKNLLDVLNSENRTHQIGETVDQICNNVHTTLDPEKAHQPETQQGETNSTVETNSKVSPINVSPLQESIQTFCAKLFGVLKPIMLHLESHEEQNTIREEVLQQKLARLQTAFSIGKLKEIALGKQQLALEANQQEANKNVPLQHDQMKPNASSVSVNASSTNLNSSSVSVNVSEENRYVSSSIDVTLNTPSVTLNTPSNDLISNSHILNSHPSRAEFDSPILNSKIKLLTQANAKLRAQNIELESAVTAVRQYASKDLQARALVNQLLKSNHCRKVDIVQIRSASRDTMANVAVMKEEQGEYNQALIAARKKWANDVNAWEVEKQHLRDKVTTLHRTYTEMKRLYQKVVSHSAEPEKIRLMELEKLQEQNMQKDFEISNLKHSVNALQNENGLLAQKYSDLFAESISTPDLLRDKSPSKKKILQNLQKARGQSLILIVQKMRKSRLQNAFSRMYYGPLLQEVERRDEIVMEIKEEREVERDVERFSSDQKFERFSSGDQEVITREMLDAQNMEYATKLHDFSLQLQHVLELQNL